MTQDSQRIKVLDKIGCGAFCNVYHVLDETGKDAVLKYNMITDSTSMNGCLRECSILTKTLGLDNFVQLRSIEFNPRFDDKLNLIPEQCVTSDGYMPSLIHFIFEKEEGSLYGLSNDEESCGFFGT